MTTQFTPDGPIERRHPPKFTPQRRNWRMICTVAAVVALVVFGALSAIRGRDTLDPRAGELTTGIASSSPPVIPSPQPSGVGGTTR